MQAKRDLGIELPKIKPGKHQITYRVQDSFFVNQEDSPISEADLEAVVDIDRSTRMIDARFALKGWVQLECDRCLKPYPQSVSSHFRVVYSFDADIKEVEDAEVVWVDTNVPFLSFAKEIFDFLILDLPMKRIPPECPTDACEPILKLIASEGASQLEADEEPPIDTRWAALLQLRERLSGDSSES